MSQIDLSTLPGQELRQLLDSARQRGHAAQSYEILQEMESREHYVWSELRTLELGPGVLRADQRPSLVAALQAARTHASDIGQLGQGLLKTAGRAGLTPKPLVSAAIPATTCQPLLSPGVD